jgi:VIT1/CCC1 family predicted Fe2+/Mn2+ transporter
VSNETRSTEVRAGDRLVKAGVIIFFVGAVATLVTVAPLFLGTDPFPSVAYAVCMLMGVGFLVAAAGVLRSIALQRRQGRAATSAT